MELKKAFETAELIIQTGERVEIWPSKDGADIYIVKRRKIDPDRKCSAGRTKRG
jgi:hypothetical protein